MDRPLGRAAPQHDAVPDRPPLVRIQQRANAGVDAVRADQRISDCFDPLAAVPLLEDRNDLVATLMEIDEPAVRMYAGGTQPLDRRAQQHAVQLAAVDTDLRRVVSRIESAQLLPDGLAEAVGINQLAGANAGGIQGRQQAERRQFLDRVRQHVDADAKLAQFPGLFVYFCFDAGAMQGEGGRQSAYAAAGDNDFHDYSPRDSTVKFRSGRGNNSNAKEFRACYVRE